MADQFQFHSNLYNIDRTYFSAAHQATIQHIVFQYFAGKLLLKLEQFEFGRCLYTEHQLVNKKAIIVSLALQYESHLKYSSFLELSTEMDEV
eukprot:c14305_g1_i1 orf=161-436(+)